MKMKCPDCQNGRAMSDSGVRYCLTCAGESYVEVNIMRDAFCIIGAILFIISIVALVILT